MNKWAKALVILLSALLFYLLTGYFEVRIWKAG